MNIRGNPYDDMKIELGVGNGEQKNMKEHLQFLILKILIRIMI